jgi:multicomponent Na+:H+ antiporter subunit F
VIFTLATAAAPAAIGRPTLLFAITVVAILITMSLALARSVLGPTVFDRILALNMFGTKTVLLIAVGGFLFNRPDFMDLALVYTLVNFAGTIAVLRFSRYGNLARDDARAQHEGAD